ncbi:MAG: hypothetical protein ACK4MR_09635, partial [Erythrobacter cryptus]
MRRAGTRLALAASLLALGLAGLASAQQKPESLLPPGFDDPAPAPSPAPRPAPSQSAGQPARPAPTSSAPALPSGPGLAPAAAAPDPASLPPLPSLTRDELARLPSIEELERMSSEELDRLLGLKPKSDIPPGAQRALTRVGVLAVEEGGLPPVALLNQPQALVRAALAGTRGPLVSRWGHILVRRALASRLAAPIGMDPVEFAALRLGLLNRLGEFALARAVAQDIDTANWSGALTEEALTAYLA